MDSYDPETGEIAAPFHFYGEVSAAIIAVAKQIRQIGQDEKNPHGGYPYVSVDKFYEIVGPLMANAGLFLVVDEVSADVREGAKGNAWLFTRYALRFVHEKGDCSPPLYRSCAQPISGPQAFGAAQSYIEKQFLRQVFKIPTGERDGDGDAIKPEENSAPTRAPASRGRTAHVASEATPVAPPPPPPPPAPPHAPDGPAANGRDGEPTMEDKRRAAQSHNDMKGGIDQAGGAGVIDAIMESQDWKDLAALMRFVGEGPRMEKLTRHAETVRAGLQKMEMGNA